ncbi:hypothetical protein PR202_ga08618 [Eleusine coracana subsp. coracana]|uniref:Uncharacterized protein n=1 Tax=Eleusine coracana subsp. coracana TaxID=191504 RepID=A0AAV5C282_ELECO|nr:hypothetical protein PR202_ga08618 [Eleusine coracana subsp. coracana]
MQHSPSSSSSSTSRRKPVYGLGVPTLPDHCAVHDLATYVSLLKNSHQPGTEERPGVMAKVMEFVGRRRAGAAVPWQDAAMQTLGLVQTLGLS